MSGGAFSFNLIFELCRLYASVVLCHIVTIPVWNLSLRPWVLDKMSKAINWKIMSHTQMCIIAY